MDTPLHNLAFYGGGSGGGGGGGGGGAAEPERDVNFIDYDGTIVYSYTADDFLLLTAMPVNPSHDGLTAQGWNWSLADAQTYVANYGKLWVGQMYITDDGKTRIYIKLEEGRLSPYLGIAVNGSVDVDWGDGSAHDTVTGSDLTTTVNTQHTYAAAGEYVITLNVIGSIALVGQAGGSNVIWAATSQMYDCVYQNAIQKVEMGANTSIGDYAFKSCNSLRFITIPSHVTSVGIETFSMNSLLAITLPSGVTSIANRAFYSCGSLASVSLPSGVTSLGDRVFYNARALSSVTLPNSVTAMGTSTFSGCSSLSFATLPNSLTAIGDNTMATCLSLVSATISESITSIGSSAFNSCYGLGFIKFKPLTPPTVSNSTAFGALPADCVIYVPRGSLEAYTTATNYPISSAYTYVEYDP